VTHDSLTAEDTEHLRILGILHYVIAGMQALFASVPILHLGMGALMLFLSGASGQKAADRLPLVFVGGFFVLFAGTWILLGWAVAACIVVAGRSLAQRRRYIFCIVVAAVEACLCIPFGTALGVFTIIVLQRPSVRGAFGRDTRHSWG
jgi:hypothetical protein